MNFVIAYSNHRMEYNPRLKFYLQKGFEEFPFWIFYKSTCIFQYSATLVIFPCNFAAPTVEFSPLCLVHGKHSATCSSISLKATTTDVIIHFNEMDCLLAVRGVFRVGFRESVEMGIIQRFPMNSEVYSRQYSHTCLLIHLILVIAEGERESLQSRNRGDRRDIDCDLISLIRFPLLVVGVRENQGKMKGDELTLLSSISVRDFRCDCKMLSLLPSG